MFSTVFALTRKTFDIPIPITLTACMHKVTMEMANLHCKSLNFAVLYTLCVNLLQSDLT